MSGGVTRIASVSGLRGWVGRGLDPVIVAEYAAAYASELGPGSVVVGHDGRASAHLFAPVVAATLNACGRDALVAGPVATPTLGRLVVDLGAAGGVQISASHNPPEYNGLKLFQPGGMVLGPDQGEAVRTRLERRDFAWSDVDGLGRVRTIEDPDAAHLERVLGIVDVDAIRASAFRVALDACHGAGGRLGGELLRWLGCATTILGAVPDGRYEHPPEPTADNLSRFAALVPALGAAVGFAQDPDADRLAIIDETGRYIGEELTVALAAMQMLGSGARGPIVLNLSTSRTLEATALRCDCGVVRTPVGEIHVVNAMRERGAILGGEGNGGVIDPAVGYVRDSFVAIARVLALMAATGRRLSELVDELPRLAMIKKAARMPVALAPQAAGRLFDRIAARWTDAAIDRRDGLHLSWPDRWAHIRASNTEPIVRVIAEAESRAAAETLADELLRALDAGGHA